MKQWIAAAFLAGILSNLPLAGKAQDSPVPLSPNEYTDHPKKIPATPSAYLAPDTSEFASVPRGPGVIFTQWHRGDLPEPNDANDGYAARRFIKDSSANGPLVAIDSNSYFYFFVVLQPDYTLTLSDITWKTRRSNTGPKYAQWQFARKSEGYVFQDLTGTLVLSGSAAEQTIPISFSPALSLAGGSTGDSILIRVLAWGASNGNGAMRIMNGTSFNATALPLTLLSFQAHCQHQQTVLSWETAQEQNVQGFVIEKSRNACDFQQTGFLAAKNGQHNQYQFTEPAVAGHTFYRLKMTDLDGTFSYSPVQAVYATAGSATVQLYPNPAQDLLWISGVAPGTHLYVLDGGGHLVKDEVVQQEGSLYKLELHAWPSGAYTLRVAQGQEVQQLLFVKK